MCALTWSKSVRLFQCGTNRKGPFQPGIHQICPKIAKFRRFFGFQNPKKFPATLRLKIENPAAQQYFLDTFIGKRILYIF